MSAWSRRSFLRAISIIAGMPWHARPFTYLHAAEAVPSAETNLLWYRGPAREWTEALPVGNGRLGAMIFGDPHVERILLNEESFWSGNGRRFPPPEASGFLPLLRDLLIQQNGPRADQVVRERFLTKTGESYQPLGFLELRHSDKAGAASAYRRSLDLQSGIHTVECTDARGVTRIERIFASAPDGVLVVRLSCPAGLYLTASLGSSLRGPVYSAPQKSIVCMEQQAPTHVIPAEIENANAAVTWDTAKNRQPLRAAVAMCVCDSAGNQRGQCSLAPTGIRIAGATSVTLLVSAATSYTGLYTAPTKDARELAVASLKRALACGGGEQIERRHGDDHRSLFNRVQLQLGELAGPRQPTHSSEDPAALPTDERLLRASAGGDDPALAALYFQMGRYLLMASSRPGSLPATTQGIWSHRVRPPAESHWALNADLETTYWLAEVGHLAECHEPLLSFISRLSTDGAETARRTYGSRGWVAHTTADIWGSTAPEAGGSTAAIWKCGGAWLALHMWEHYRFSGDLTFLETAYPIMRGASAFFLDHLREDWDGWLAMYPESSFENAYHTSDGVVALSALGPAMSNSIVRELLASTASAAATLALDDDLQRRLHLTLKQLRPLATQPKTGELLEWANSDWYPEEKNTDQLPQIWALHPGTQINPDFTPELALAAHTSLLKRTPWLRNSGGPLTALYAGALARLGDGETAHALLQEHLSAAVQPSLLSGDSARGAEWRMSGNTGVASAIPEMLLQSHAGEVHFLPALPSAWSSGSFRGLRARGGLAVDLQWKLGRAQRAVLHAAADGRHVLRAPKHQRIASVTALSGSAGMSAMARLSPERLAFQSTKGGAYSVTFA